MDKNNTELLKNTIICEALDEQKRIIIAQALQINQELSINDISEWVDGDPLQSELITVLEALGYKFASMSHN